MRGGKSDRKVKVILRVKKGGLAFRGQATLWEPLRVVRNERLQGSKAKRDLFVLYNSYLLPYEKRKEYFQYQGWWKFNIGEEI